MKKYIPIILVIVLFGAGLALKENLLLHGDEMSNQEKVNSRCVQDILIIPVFLILFIYVKKFLYWRNKVFSSLFPQLPIAVEVFFLRLLIAIAIILTVRSLTIECLGVW